MTVPVAAMPPTTLLWDNVTADTRVVTVRVAVLLTALYVPVSVTVAFVVTVVVVTANVAFVAPWATVTLRGTEAAALLLESVTRTPPAGAATSRVTVPVAPVMLPTTAVGLTERAARFAANAEGDASRSGTRSHALRAIQCSLKISSLVPFVRGRITRREGKRVQFRVF